MTAFPSAHPVAEESRCVHCAAACARRDETGVPYCTLEHLLFARILGTAHAVCGTPATSPSVTAPAEAGGSEEA